MAAWHLYLSTADTNANPENVIIIQHNNSRDAAQYVMSTAKAFIPLNRTKNIFPPVTGFAYEVKPNKGPINLLENDKNKNDEKKPSKNDTTEESPQW
jgi:hypothetical protein